MKKKPFLRATLSLLTLSGLLAASVHAQETKPSIAMCIGCHGIVGYQASFPEVYKVPMISGQNAKYIAAALTAYRKGDRKHPTMRSIAASLTDQNISDVAAYYSSSGANLHEPAGATEEATPEVQALLVKGNCTSCHGPGLNKPIDGAYPKIAGQHAEYLQAALKAYATGGNPLIGRNNPIMGAQVKLFKPEELKVLAKYIGGLPGDLKTVPEPGLH